MNIKPMIYENLTPKQRLIAVIEAIARNDVAEEERLTATCPKKRYEQADYQYSGVMQGLIAQAICNEMQINGLALSMMAALHYGKDDFADRFWHQMIDQNGAWDKQIESMGIDPKTMRKIVSNFRHPIVALFLADEHGQDYEPDAASADDRRIGMKEFFDKIQSV